MRIEAYFEQIQVAIGACPVIQISDITFDKRGSYEGYIRCELQFIDGSILSLREFVDVELDPERLMYVYHYMDQDRDLIFRYDNSGHYRKSGLPTYPHHKHLGRDEMVIPSNAPDLVNVLSEIQSLVELS